MEVFHSPDDSKTFQLSDKVIAFSFVEAAAGISNGIFIFSILLCKYSTNASPRSISMEIEGFGIVRVLQDRRSDKEPFQYFKGLLVNIHPFKRSILFQESIERACN